MSRKRKKRTKPESERQLSLFSKNENSTHQVPCGLHSIFYDDSINPFPRSVYFAINKRSNWETGRSHALPHSAIAKDLNVKNSSQIAAAIKILVEAGWIEILGKRKKKGAGQQACNMYQVIHHKPPEGEAIPMDQDGRPLKCAITDQIWEKIAQGNRTWKELIVFYSMKVESKWDDGEIETTLGYLVKLCNFGRKTIKDCLEKLMESSLIRKVKSFLYELLPPPAKPKKERKEGEAAARVKVRGDFYYSLNGKWRMQAGTFKLEMKKGFQYWVDGDWYDLKQINRSIYDDFIEFRDNGLELRMAISEQFIN